MSPASFKSAREALGLPVEYVAGRVGVNASRVWEYESPARTIDVPDRAAEAITELANAFDEALCAAVERYSHPEVEAVPRHVHLERFWEEHPQLEGWPQLSQGLLLAQVSHHLGKPIQYKH